MKKILAIVLSLATVFSLVACGTTDTTTEDVTTAAESTAPEAEAASNALTIAVGAQFTTLDPALNTETVNNYVLTHTMSGMFKKDANGIAQLELCSAYEVSDDGLIYTFHISEDANWSDGQPVTAQDFVYSYLRALSYGADNAWATNDMINFIAGAAEYNAAALEAGTSFDCTTEPAESVGIKAIDDKTLELTLKTPCVYLPGLMSSNVWIPVREDFAPQHESLWAFEGGYPTAGAYTLESCNENEKAEIVKNPSYIKADEITVDSMVFLCMPDYNAQALAFESGELQVALGISPETAVSYQGKEELWTLAKSSNYFLAINSGSTGPDWAKDVRVRKALALAIDKNALVDVLGGEMFYPVLNGYVPNGVSGKGEKSFREEGDEDGYSITYDVEQAKALLAEAGYDESNPLTITYKYSNNGIHGDVAVMLQQMWAAVGVTAEMACVESGVFYDQLDAGDFEISRYGYSAADSPMQFLELWTTGIQVVAAVDDPALDQMCEEARQITDYDAYIDRLHEIEDYMAEENVYVIPLFNYNDPALVAANVSNYYMAGETPYFGHVVIK